VGVEIMMWKTLHGNELFVWWNGELIFKRWLTQGYSMVFDKYGPPF